MPVSESSREDLDEINDARKGEGVASELAQTSTDAAQSLASEEREVAQAIKDKSADIVDDAKDAAVGAALPRTETEDSALGEARDALIQRVSDASVERYDDGRGAVSTQVERVEEAVGHSYDRAKDEVDRVGISATGSAVAVAAGEVTEAPGAALVDVVGHVAPDNRELHTHDAGDGPHPGKAR